VRGEPGTPPPAQRPPSVLESRRRGHSQKPDEIYELIETWYPTSPRVELFARQQRPGWAAWGDEVPAGKCLESFCSQGTPPGAAGEAVAASQVGGSPGGPAHTRTTRFPGLDFDSVRGPA
jgi:hypothetical protein